MSDYVRKLREKLGHDVLLMPAVSVAVLDDRHRILLIRHSEGNVWVLPGGAIDPEELPSDAAVRETWEETGLIIEPTRILALPSHF